MKIRRNDHAKSDAPGTGVDPPVPSRRWWVGVLIGGILLAGLVASLVRPWARRSAPPMPELNLSAADPALVEGYEAAVRKVRQRPHSADAWGRLGMVLLANGYVEESVPVLEYAWLQDAHNVRWPYYLAHAVKGSDPPQAIAALRAVIATDPLLAVVPRLRLSALLLSEGDAPAARVVAEEAAAIAPSDPWVQLHVGHVAAAEGRHADALAALEKARAVSPAIKPVRLQLARVYQALGRPDDARAEEAEAAELFNSDLNDPFAAELDASRYGLAPALQRCESLMGGGEYDTAVLALRVLTRRYPESVNAWKTLGIAARFASQPETAEAALVEALRLRPGDATLHTLLASVLVDQGRLEEAEAQVKHAVDNRPDYPDAVFIFGIIEQRRGRHDEAQARLSEARNLGCSIPELGVRLAESLEKSGRREQAIDEVRALLARRPGDAEAAALLETMSQSDPER